MRKLVNMLGRCDACYFSDKENMVLRSVGKRSCLIGGGSWIEPCVEYHSPALMPAEKTRDW